MNKKQETLYQEDMVLTEKHLKNIKCLKSLQIVFIATGLLALAIMVIQALVRNVVDAWIFVFITAFLCSVGLKILCKKLMKENRLAIEKIIKENSYV